MISRRLAPIMLVTLLAGCVSVGPKSIHRDQIDYGSAMSKTMKEQAVLNIVKSRYVDWPSFLEVSQIVAGYSLARGATLGFNWFPDADASTNQTTSITGTLTESPTITYSPLVGKDFVTTLLEPLDVEAVLAVAYTGWKVDRLLELTINSINGLRNAQYVGDTSKAADPDFWRVLDLLRELQTANAWSLQRETGKSSGKGRGLELTFRARDDAPELGGKIAELKELLGLDPAAASFAVVYEDEPQGESVIAVESRTLWEFFWEMQRYVEVPSDDVAAGRANRASAAADDRQPVLRIRSGASAPGSAFVAVPYRDSWFWIDDDDLESKHTLSVILLMSTLARSSSVEPPRLVIPTR